MQLKNYQNEAIKDLLERSEKLLNSSGNKKLVFKSPTGSGKTIITAHFLKELIVSKKFNKRLSFIWAAPRFLHNQSKQKLEEIYDNNKSINCSNFEDLIDKIIPENEILFLNWESINKKNKNTIIKENEKEFYLSKIIEKTQDQGRDIILIIDESHFAAPSEISKTLISDIISPKLTIEISATPKQGNFDEFVSVDIENVKNEGMIKKTVILQDGMKNKLSGENLISDLENSSDEIVLSLALDKRKKLKTMFQHNKSKINPLLLIQLPDARNLQDETLKKDVIDLLKTKYNITVQNNKLALWLNNEKTDNLRDISENDSEVEVLIFKHALALGWDCPRAQILLLFRDWKSYTFSIQTIGRIMRMPEPNKGHYLNNELNNGYVYTNLSDININEDIAKNYLTIFTGKLSKQFKNINLQSVHTKRQREKTRLNTRFVEIFLQEAKKYSLSSKIKLINQNVKKEFILEFQSDNIDNINETDNFEKIEINTNNDKDLQKLFDEFIINNLTPFFPEERSVAKAKEAIYNYFLIEQKLDFKIDFSKIIKIILSQNNLNHFSNVIELTKNSYIELNKTSQKNLTYLSEWKIPENINYNMNYKELNVKKSAIQPFYIQNNSSKPELEFIKFLENNSKVKWWFKNGERDGTFFAVPYEENDTTKPFYVDFIIKFTNEKIGLFDTKSGWTIDSAKEKSSGLLKYIKENNNLIGGIATNSKKNFDGSWIFFDKKSDVLKSNDLSNWEFFPS